MSRGAVWRTSQSIVNHHSSCCHFITCNALITVHRFAHQQSCIHPPSVMQSLVALHTTMTNRRGVGHLAMLPSSRVMQTDVLIYPSSLGMHEFIYDESVKHPPLALHQALLKHSYITSPTNIQSYSCPFHVRIGGRTRRTAGNSRELE